MAITYFPDELLIKIISAGHNKTKFVREAIEARLEWIKSVEYIDNEAIEEKIEKENGMK